MSNDKGYTYAYRSAWYHPAFNNLREAAIWNYLYQNAFWEDGEKNMGGHVFKLKRGQIAVSISYLAKGFGMTEKGVRVVIQKLEKLGMVVTQGASRGTIITISNYDTYQKKEKAKGGHKGEQRATKGRAEGENNNEGNEGNDVNEGNEVIVTRTPYEKLTVDDVKEWLTKKRVAGKYLTIDEHALLEKFQDYCRANNPKYKDYVAAFRNSFDWNNAPKKGTQNETNSRNPAKPNKLERAESALNRGIAAYQAQLQHGNGMAAPALPPARPVIPDFQRVREGAGSAGSDLSGVCEDFEPIPD